MEDTTASETKQETRTLAQQGEDAREEAWLVGKGHIPAWASPTEKPRTSPVSD